MRVNAADAFRRSREIDRPSKASYHPASADSMKHLRVRLIRCCPKCNNFDVRRSHRKGLLESLVLPLFLLRPFRCNACQSRHINFVFCQKASPKAAEADDAD
jgi:hypothetical protein